MITRSQLLIAARIATYFKGKFEDHPEVKALEISSDDPVSFQAAAILRQAFPEIFDSYLQNSLSQIQKELIEDVQDLLKILDVID